jgi:hypothetical protein
MKLSLRCAAAVLLIVNSTIAGEAAPAVVPHSKAVCGGSLNDRCSVREATALDEIWDGASRVSLEF